MAVDAVTQAGVQETLEKFRRGYEAKDMDLMVSCFAEDDVSIFGTAADEKRIGLEQIKFQIERDFSQADRIRISYSNTSVSCSGTVAWSISDVDIAIKSGDQLISIQARLTVVMEKFEENWRIRHLHLSLPDKDTDEGHSFPES